MTGMLYGHQWARAALESGHPRPLWQQKRPLRRGFLNGRCRARTSDLLLVREARRVASGCVYWRMAASGDTGTATGIVRLRPLVDIAFTPLSRWPCEVRRSVRQVHAPGDVRVAAAPAVDRPWTRRLMRHVRGDVVIASGGQLQPDRDPLPLFWCVAIAAGDSAIRMRTT